MAQVKELRPYSDAKGNTIVYDGAPLDGAKVDVIFRGSNNRLVVHPGAAVVDLAVDFSGDGGSVEIGSTTKKRAGLRFSMRLGYESAVVVGSNVGCETRAFIRVSEGSRVIVGQDCMLASSIELRADDSHAIYDVHSGLRINPAAPIIIGEHVWLGKNAVVMAGVTIGDGSVIGFRSVVTRDVPNNCIAAGAPARVVRRDIAWERPMLSYRRPGIDGLAPGETKSAEWWNRTVG